MPIILTKKAKMVFPEGTYKAWVEKIEMDKSKFEDKEIVKIQFKTDYQPKPNEAAWKITLSCTASLHEKSRLYYVIEKLTGQGLKEGQDFDVETLKGKVCFVQVEHQVSDSGNIYAKVADVFRVEEKLKEAGYDL